MPERDLPAPLLFLSLLGIAMQGGNAVRTGGTRSGQACGVKTKRGTMFCYNSG